MSNKILIIVSSIMLLIANMVHIITIYIFKNREKNFTDDKIVKMQNIPEIEKIRMAYNKYVESNILDPILIVSPKFWDIIRTSWLIQFNEILQNYTLKVKQIEIRTIIRDDIPNNVDFLLMSHIDYIENFEMKSGIYEGNNFRNKED